MEKKTLDEKELEKLLASKEIDDELLDEIPDELLFNDDLDDPSFDELGGLLGNLGGSPKAKPVKARQKTVVKSEKKAKPAAVKQKTAVQTSTIREITAESMNEKLEIIEQDVGDIKHAMAILLSAVSSLSKAVDRLEKKSK